MNTLKLTMSGKIYAIIGLSFMSLFGIATFQLHELKSGLEDQKKLELRHLGESAQSIAKQEYAKAQKGQISEEQAKENAAQQIGALRYGNDDYFWINDLQPRMIMHPTRELIGTDISDIKDPSGRRVFLEFNEIARKQGGGFDAYGRRWGGPSRSPSFPMS